MTNIQVVVRCRERTSHEQLIRSPVIVELGDDTYSADEPCVAVLNTSREPDTRLLQSSHRDISSYKTYRFDQICGFHASQSLVFDKVALPLFNDFYHGVNTTLLAYGQTGTGKTHTMSGDFTESLDNAGIIPRVLVHLFDCLDRSDNDYLVKCSYLELYKEELRDLLVESDPNLNTRSPPLVIYENNSTNAGLRGIRVQNLTEASIDSSKRALDLLARGMNIRKTASTKLNDVSSRSHTIFTISLYKKVPVEQSLDKQEYFQVSKMNMVDLAGSENISRLGAKNNHAKEAGSINKSLLTLGRVISVLSDAAGPCSRPPSAPANTSHIPYRESKLTRLLQDSIGGSTKTTLIATISPARSSMEETVSTLEYASKAKNIRNLPQAGDESSTVLKKILVKNMAAEAVFLARTLEATRNKTGVYLSEENYRKLVSDNEAYAVTETESKSKISALERQLADQAADFHAKQSLFQKTSSEQTAQLHALETELNNHRTASNARIQKLLAQLSQTQRDLSQSVERAKSLEDRLCRASGKFNATTTDYVMSTRDRIEECFSAIEALHTEIRVANILPQLHNASLELTNSNTAFLQSIRDKTKVASSSMARDLDNELPQIFSQILKNVSALSLVIDTFKKLAAHTLDDLCANNTQFSAFLQQSLLNQDSHRSMQHQLQQNMESVMQHLYRDVQKQNEKLIDSVHASYCQAFESQINQQCVSMANFQRQELGAKQAVWERSCDETVQTLTKNIEQLAESSIPQVVTQCQTDLGHAQTRISDRHRKSVAALDQIVQFADESSLATNAAAQLQALAESAASRDNKFVANLNAVSANLHGIKHLEMKVALDSSPLKPDQSLDSVMSTPSGLDFAHGSANPFRPALSDVPAEGSSRPASRLPSRSPARPNRPCLTDIPPATVMATSNVHQPKTQKLAPGPTNIPTLSITLSLVHSKENEACAGQPIKKRRVWQR